MRESRFILRGKNLIAHLVDRFFIKKPAFRELITRLLWRDCDEPVEVLGTRLYANTIRENGYHRARGLVASSSLWRDEAPVLLSLAMLLKGGDTFVDVGANVGLYCASLARSLKLGYSIRFYAFEANPDTYRRLVRSVEDLEVETYNLALSDRSGSLEFVGGCVSHVFTTVENAGAHNYRHKTELVSCCRLDDIPIVGDSVVLKIDVEGQERQVLDGARGLFQAGRIKAVYLDGYRDSTITDLLRSYGFTLRDGRNLALAAPHTFSLLALKQTSAV